MDIVTFLSPSEIQEPLLRGKIAVVIDALRFTSTAVAALANGCLGVIPMAEVNDAITYKRGSKAEILLGGERGGKIIPGFDLGNSPFEYTAERVKGRFVVSTTTNGTRTLLKAAPAEGIFAGSFFNAKATARALKNAAGIAFVCAGNEGRMALEDVLAAGCITDRLMAAVDPQNIHTDDETQTALSLYRAEKDDLLGAMKRTSHGQFLLSLSKLTVAELHYCIKEDLFDTVAIYRDGMITAQDD
jgi:2-phosphosulfolactate phosphatase